MTHEKYLQKLQLQIPKQLLENPNGKLVIYHDNCALPNSTNPSRIWQILKLHPFTKADFYEYNAWNINFPNIWYLETQAKFLTLIHFF